MNQAINSSAAPSALKTPRKWRVHRDHRDHRHHLLHFGVMSGEEDSSGGEGAHRRRLRCDGGGGGESWSPSCQRGTRRFPCTVAGRAAKIWRESWQKMTPPQVGLQPDPERRWRVASEKRVQISHQPQPTSRPYLQATCKPNGMQSLPALPHWQDPKAC